MNRKQARLIQENYKDAKLLPCPFCASKEDPPMLCFSGERGVNEVWFTIICPSCGCEPNSCAETPEEAINFWNERKILSITNETISSINIVRNKIIEVINNIENDIFLEI